MLTENEGYVLFLIYGVIILSLVLYTSKKSQGADDFLVMGRGLGVFRGALSMAVSWIWAPAIFICSLQAYEQGLPGVFWFTAPNILTFFVFAIFAVKMREILPKGYVVSEIFHYKFPKVQSVHIAASVVTFGYQLGAIIINCVAGATLINLLSGISFEIGVLLMAGLSLSYSLISGLRASVLSDVAQMLMILFITIIIVPWVVIEAGGIAAISSGLGGYSGEYRNVLDPGVAFAFGIAMTLGLLSGPVADQMFSQRAFAAKKSALVKIFIYGGLIFGLVPIVLSVLGFIGASGVQNGLFEISDSQMVGPEVVGYYLPKWALALFAIMAFAGLTSTLDSAFNAVGSLTAKLKIVGSDDNKTILIARLGMVLFAFIGVSIALLRPELLWVFLIYGALASSIFIPSFLALYWDKLNGKAAAIGIISSFIIGTPLSIYANVTGNTDLIVLAALISITLSGVISFTLSLLIRKYCN